MTKVPVQLDRDFMVKVAELYKNKIDKPEKMEQLPMALLSNLVFLGELMATVGYDKETAMRIASSVIEAAHENKTAEKNLAEELKPDLGLE